MTKEQRKKCVRVTCQGNAKSTKESIIGRIKVEVWALQQDYPEDWGSCVICGKEPEAERAGAALVEPNAFETYYYKENGEEVMLPEPNQPGEGSPSEGPLLHGFVCRECLSKGLVSGAFTLEQRRQALVDKLDQMIAGLRNLVHKDWTTVEEMDRRIAEYFA